MKKDLEEKNKRIYKISDLMIKTKVTARTIRYYDSEGLFGEVKRSVGYTRYFTDDDVKRLKEIIKLKKKGHKIADIKAIFNTKYKVKINNFFPNISFSDVFLDEKDITLAQQLDIEIIPSEIKIKSIKIPYLQWPTISSDIQNEPFEMKSSKTSNRNYQWNISTIKSGLVSTPRNIFNYISKNYTKEYCSESEVIKVSKRSFEWLILPINISLKKHQPEEQYYFVKYHFNESYIENIWKESVLISNIEKQIKESITPFNGLMNQVTIHSNKKDKQSSKLVKALQLSFPNPFIFNLDPLTPYYQYLSGSNQAIFLSII